MQLSTKLKMILLCAVPICFGMVSLDTRMAFESAFLFAMLGVGLFVTGSSESYLQSKTYEAENIFIPMTGILLCMMMVVGLSGFAIMMRPYQLSLLKIIPFIVLILLFGIGILYHQVTSLLNAILRSEKKALRKGEQLKASKMALEQEIIEINRFQQTLLDSANYSIIAVDSLGIIRSYNKIAEHYLGYTAEEVIGKQTPLLFHESEEVKQRALELSQELGQEVQPDIETFMAKAKLEGSETREWTYIRKDGSRLPVSLSISIVRNSHGEVTGCLGIATDITQEKELKHSNEDAYLQLQESVHELNVRNEQLLRIKDLISLLQTCYSIEETADLVSQYCGQLLPDTAGGLYLMSSENQLIELVLSWGKLSAVEKIFPLEDCWGLRKGGVYKYIPEKIGLLCNHCKKNGSDLRYHLCIPLLAQSAVIGLFYVESEETQPENSYHELIAMTLAEQLGLGISNILLREKMQYQSTHDSLTNLWNRRYLDETLTREIYRAEREEQQLAIILLDIDHFKMFNDNFGHQAGDLVLTAIAEEFKRHIRRSDIVSRYGGEEFIIVLLNTQAQKVLEIAKKICSALQKMRLHYSGTALPEITMSGGIAIYPTDGATIHELIIAADARLYQAKREGRNRIIQG